MKTASSRRAHKMGDQILRVVAEALITEASDPRLRLITISGVRMSKDLSTAEILYSAPKDSNLQAIAKSLDQAAGFFRATVGRELKSKYIPKIQFRYDIYLEEMIYDK